MLNDSHDDLEGRWSNIGWKLVQYPTQIKTVKGKYHFWPSGNILEMRLTNKTCKKASSGEEMIIILQLLAHTRPRLIVPGKSHI